MGRVLKIIVFNYVYGFFIYVVDFCDDVEFSGHGFKKSSDIKFHENPFIRRRVFHADRRADRQT